jgi:hypothetical protein
MPLAMSTDPFQLDGKNLPRVAPQIARQIKLQQGRIQGFILVTVLLAIIGGVWATVGYVPAVVGIICFAMIPFAVLGIVCDYHILKRQRAKLAECERRLQKVGEGIAADDAK